MEAVSVLSFANANPNFAARGDDLLFSRRAGNIAEQGQPCDETDWKR